MLEPDLAKFTEDLKNAKRTKDVTPMGNALSALSPHITEVPEESIRKLRSAQIKRIVSWLILPKSGTLLSSASSLLLL